MNASLCRRSHLLALVVVMIALALYAAPVPQARAQAAPPDWYSWNFKIDFPGASPRVIMTSYWGVNGVPISQPVAVTGSAQADISGRCRVVGSLPITAGTASFNGSSYIRCALPASEVSAMGEHCSGSGAPFFWGAVRGTIAAGSTRNPLFTLSNSTTRSLVSAFSLPRSGATVQTQFQLPLATYTSAAWSLNAGENRVLMSSDGPSIASIRTSFAANNWLNFMGSVTSPARSLVGNWAEPAMMYWTTPRQPEGYRVSNTFDVGYNMSDGTYFAGTMSDGEFDPPGCTAK
jgi:hypothetical protein